MQSMKQILNAMGDSADPKVAARAADIQKRRTVKQRQVSREEIEKRWNFWHQQCFDLFADKGLDPDADVAFKLACFYADYKRWHAGEHFGHTFAKPKGLFVYGPYGSGKTEAVRTIVVNLRETVRAKFLLRHSRDLIQDYCTKDEVLEYLRHYDHNADVFLDDVGIEGCGMRYGVKWSIGDYIQTRYDRCTSFDGGQRKIRYTTLITSNLANAQEIEAKYGTRTLSTLVDICDFVPYARADRRLARLAGYRSQ